MNDLGSQEDMGISQNNNQNDGPTEEDLFFNKFECPEMEKKDPSLEEDFSKVYENEIPFEIRTEGVNDSKSSINENLGCKVLIGGDFNSPSCIKVELTCDKDLFFFYSCTVDKKIFAEMQSQQKLNCKYKDYGHMLIKYFEDCINEPKTFMGVFHAKKDNTAVVEFVENLVHKFGLLLKLNFKYSADDLIRKQISYRYNLIRSKNQLVKNRMKIINSVLKKCDPPLIPEVQDAVSKVKVDTKLRDQCIINHTI